MASRKNKRKEVFTLTHLGAPACNPKRNHPFQIEVMKDGKTVLYGSKSQVVVRNLEDPTKSMLVSGHNGTVTVARVAPNGIWVASGDDDGKCRVWALTRPENVKLEKDNMGINDLSWDGESKRIAVGGISGGYKAAVFNWDSGSELGKIENINKAVNSVDLKKGRPLRLATGSEDFKVNFYSGPPFKFEGNKKTNNFVNCVRFSPDGKTLCAISMDSSVRLFDGKTFDPIKDLNSTKAGRMLYSCSWSPDSKAVLVSGSDRAARIFDIESGLNADLALKAAAEPQLHHSLQATGFSGKAPLGVTLGGDIVRWGELGGDVKPEAPEIFTGHTASVSSMAKGKDGVVFTADVDGGVLAWTADQKCRRISGNGDKDDSRIVHKGGVCGLAVTGDWLVSVGDDQVCRSVKLDGTSFAEGNAGPLGGTPAGLAGALDGSAAVAVLTNGKAVVIRDGAPAGTTSLKKAPNQAVAMSPDGKEVLVGTKKSEVHRYSCSGGSLKFTEEIDIEEHSASCIAYSPDGKLFALGDTNGEVKLWELEDTEGAMLDSYWTYHKAQIMALAWSPDSKMLCSGSMDRNLIMWYVGQKRSYVMREIAHYRGVEAVHFLSHSAGACTLVTGGCDNAVKWWNYAAPPVDSDEESEEDY